MIANMDNVKSTVPLDIGFANPAFARVGFVMDSTVSLRSMMIEIQKLARQGHSFGEIKKIFAETGHAAALKTFFDRFKAIPDTPPVIPVPPPSNQLYGRFYDGTSIVDAGSGNGNKLIKFSGSLKITCVDPELDVGASVFQKTMRVDISAVLPDLPLDAFLTSFMSLCQMKRETQLAVAKFDGLHMVPDHDQLVSMGAAEYLENGILVRTPRRDYVDEPLTLTGYGVAPGYLLAPTYADRCVIVKLGSEVKTLPDYRPVVDATPCDYEDINLRDVSMKMDGTAHEIEIHDGVANVVDRAGRERVGTSDFDGYMCLHAEELFGCWTLIRVVVYRGFVPPHYYGGLLEFVSHVKIKINDKPLCAPPEWVASDVDRNHALVQYDHADGSVEFFREKTDGLISRDRERDYYCKHRWTVDLVETQLGPLTAKLLEKGMVLDTYLEPGLWEYGIDRVGSNVYLQPLRKRDDKTTPTTTNTVLYLLSRATLEEGMAMARLGQLSGAL